MSDSDDDFLLPGLSNKPKASSGGGGAKIGGQGLPKEEQDKKDLLASLGLGGGATLSSAATATSTATSISGAKAGAFASAVSSKPKDEGDYASNLLSGLKSGGGGRPGGGRPGGRPLAVARRNPFASTSAFLADSPPDAALSPPTSVGGSKATIASPLQGIVSPVTSAPASTQRGIYSPTTTTAISDAAAAEAVMREAGLIDTIGPSGVRSQRQQGLTQQPQVGLSAFSPASSGSGFDGLRTPGGGGGLLPSSVSVAPLSSTAVAATAPPSFLGVSAPTVPPTPSSHSMAHQHSQGHETQAQAGFVGQSVAAVVSPFSSAPASAPPAPPPPAVVVTVSAEAVAKLRKQVEEKKLMLQQLEEREKDIAEQQKREAERHASSIKALDEELRVAWAEAEAERVRCDQLAREAEEEQDTLLQSERRRIDDEVAAMYKPRIEELTEELKTLREKRTQLSQSLNAAAANKDAVADAVAAAVKTIAERMEAHYVNHVAKDEAWEQHIRGLIRKEIRTSFASAAASDGEAEREEYKKAFDDMLAFWREAEEDNKAFIAKLDEQMMKDLKSVALEDMRRIQGEEQRVQEVYMEARESWARYHRNNLTEELEAAIQRRTVEFEEHRAARQTLHVEHINQLEKMHTESTALRQSLHEKELATVRLVHNERELLAAEKSKMILAVQEDAAKATQSLSDTIQGVNKALLKLEQYRLSVDEGRSQLDTDRKKALELKSNTLADVQAIILSQANAVEAERKALASALVKLQVVQRSVESQMEDERAWVASMGAKLERSRGEWEREYRRWQQVAQQEKLDAEERFSKVLMDLRKTAVGLDQQGNELEVEACALRRYCTERSVRQSNALQELQKREGELSQRHDELLQLMHELEGQGRGISAQWEDLHKERQELALQRDVLRQEELRMNQMADNLRILRSQFDVAAGEAARATDRNRTAHHQLAITREAVNSDMLAIREQSERLLTQKENLAKEQQRVSAALMMGDGGDGGSGEGGGEGIFGGEQRGILPRRTDDKRRGGAITDVGGRNKGPPVAQMITDRKTARLSKNDPNRLPQKVLGELRSALTQSLANAGSFGHNALVAAGTFGAPPRITAVAAAGGAEMGRGIDSHPLIDNFGRKGDFMTEDRRRAFLESQQHRRSEDVARRDGGRHDPDRVVDDTTMLEPSRISNGRSFQDPNSLHFTRLVGMSEFETTSASRLGVQGGEDNDSNATRS